VQLVIIANHLEIPNPLRRYISYSYKIGITKMQSDDFQDKIWGFGRGWLDMMLNEISYGMSRVVNAYGFWMYLATAT
jgi:hypothetical protein